MTADGSIIIWEIIRKFYLALDEARDKGGADSYLYLGRAYAATGDYNYASSVYGETITCQAGAECEKSTMNWVCVKWQKRTIRMLWKTFGISGGKTDRRKQPDADLVL